MRVIVFIVLKIVEISVVVFIPYFVGMFLIWTGLDPKISGVCLQWLFGAWAIITTFTIIELLLMFFKRFIPYFISENWKMSRWILKKIKESYDRF